MSLFLSILASFKVLTGLSVKIRLMNTLATHIQIGGDDHEFI